MATHISLYAFDGTSTKDGLSIDANEQIEVIQKEESGWWKGRSCLTGEFGWFPASYVKEISRGLTLSLAVKPQLSRQDTQDDIESTYEEIGPPNPNYGDTSSEPQQDMYEEVNHAKVQTMPSKPVPPAASKPTLVTNQSPPPVTDNQASPPVVNQKPPPQVNQQVPPPANIPKPTMPPPSGPPKVKMPSGPPPQKPGAPPPPVPKPKDKPPPPPVGTTNNRENYFEQVGPAQNIPEIGGSGGGFCDNFWNDKGGKTGFDVLVLKHRNGKEIFKELSEFMKGRAMIEDAYGKALIKFAKQGETFKDIGFLHEAWLKVKAELLSTGEAHVRFGTALSTSFTKRIMDFKDTQKGTRKQYEATISAKRKSLVATVPNVEKLHEVYSSLCIECIKYREGAEAGQQDNQTKKDYMRICETLEKTVAKRDTAGKAFKKSLEEYNTVQLEWINEMMLACKEFEDAELDRINFLKMVMSDYAQASKDTISVVEQKSTDIATAYGKVAPANEVAAWTEIEGTGRDRPKPYPYMTPAVIEASHKKAMAVKADKRKSKAM